LTQPASSSAGSEQSEQIDPKMYTNILISRPVAMASPTTVGLSPLGKAFFGSLTAGTFYLGCWQTQRYFEKQELVAQRQHDLSLDPEPLTSDHDTKVLRRKLVKGTYSHEKEVLVGPRGPPPGAMAASGPSSGRNEGGMSSSPQVKMSRGDLIKMTRGRTKYSSDT
jgi:hypothetical protein